MIQNDYLMRVIQELGRFFAQVATGSDVADPAGTQLLIEERLSDFFNTRRIFLFDRERHFSNYSPQACSELGRLLALHSKLGFQLGETENSKTSLMWALEALIRALTPIASQHAFEAQVRLVELLRDDTARQASDSEVASAYRALFEFAVIHKQYALAEDYFFAAIQLEKSSDFVAKGQAYFESLTQVNEAQLMANGMSLEEIDGIIIQIAEI